MAENRILAGIQRITERVQKLSAEKQTELSNSLKTSWSDLCQYQNLQAAAFACGKLTLEEAQTLYQIYGGEIPSEEKWDRLTLAEKVIGTQTAGELLKMKLCDIL